VIIYDLSVNSISDSFSAFMGEYQLVITVYLPTLTSQVWDLTPAGWKCLFHACSCPQTNNWKSFFALNWRIL